MIEREDESKMAQKRFTAVTQGVRRLTRAEQTEIETETGESKMAKVLEYSSGRRVEIPCNKDGSIKWFDDSRLIRK